MSIVILKILPLLYLHVSFKVVRNELKSYALLYNTKAVCILRGLCFCFIYSPINKCILFVSNLLTTIDILFAIKKGEIYPWYQPIYDSSSGRITGFEVLARWVKKSGVVVMPDNFIPHAEKFHLIKKLTRSLMDKVSVELNEVLPEDISLNIGINFSINHILDPDFSKECNEFVDSFKKRKICLVLELSERDSYGCNDIAKRKLFNLHECGIKIALDDFGTGFSNLCYIGNLPVDTIKLDRVFIANIKEDKSCFTTDALLNILFSTNIKIIAEGVETQHQRQWLSSRGIILHQGYLYSPPVPYDKIEILFMKLHEKEYRNSHLKRSN